MKRPLLPAVFILVVLLWSCNNAVAISDTKTAPPLSAEDESFANVYAVLDGNWKGQFLIYQDPDPQPVGQVDLRNLDKESIDFASFKLINTIEVEQRYTSESPYFQRVQITDFYPETGERIESQGVNKIQNGKMWCVVEKPDDLIIHQGRLEGENTIIWQQMQDVPQRIEYFQETVDEQFYEIIGYGYYEGDDTRLSPKLWFYSRYERQ